MLTRRLIGSQKLVRGYFRTSEAIAMKVVTTERPGAEEVSPSENPPEPADLGGRPNLLLRKPPRRRTKNSGRRFRLKREFLDPSARICSRPETPLLKWKFDEERANNDDSMDDQQPSREGVGGRIRAAISARKLAAGLWRMKIADVQDQRAGVQAGGNNLINMEDATSSGHSDSGRKQRPHFKCPNSEMEGTVKALKPSGHRSAAIISALESELDQAKARINELETERRSSNKKLKQFLERVSEEKAVWRSREHDKIRAIINDMKAELLHEKKNRQRLEMVNSKLMNELANIKVSAKRYVHEYEKERKSRELIEEVCDELAKEIGEDKAEVEALKQETILVREEVEEERKMLQMAEIWREERVQMKLVDAKLMLEEKYNQMNQLIDDLDCFLRSTAQTVDLGEIKKVQFLKQVAESVNMQDIRNLKYEPPNQDEIFSIFENVMGESQHKGDEEPFSGYSPMSHYSNIHKVSPEVKKVSRDVTRTHHNGYTDQSGALEDDTSEWETMSQAEDDRGSSYGSDPSVSRRFNVNNASRSRTRREDDAGAGTPVFQISEVSSASKIWKSCPINGDNYTIISVDGNAASRLSNGTITSKETRSEKGGFIPYDLCEQMSSPESGKRHGVQAKGCIEWPRGGIKGSLKARLMEARMENRKIQLREVLQQKM